MRRRLHDWERLMAEFDASGLSRAEFCRQRNLNYTTMSKWITRRTKAVLAGNHRSRHRKDCASEASPFVEVSIASEARPAAYEVVLRTGRSIRVPADFDADAVTRLILAVESC